MTRVIIITVFIALTGSSFCQQAESSKIFNVIFKQDFEDDTPGIYNYNEFMEDWKDPDWSDPRRSYWDSYGQILIVDDAGNKILRHDIMQGEASTDNTHGMQWWTPLDASYNELYFSYRMKLKPGFQPVLSGKFPGVKGGPTPLVDNPPKYDEGFLHMLTWNFWPDLVTYIYHQDQPTQSGDPFPLGYGLPTGVWITATFRIVMNTVNNDRGNNDGILETYIENNLVQQLTNLRFRNYESFGIEQLLITNFFGGDPTPQWAAARDEYVDFDDFFAFTYKPEVNVPHGYELSPPDRILLLPHELYNDSVWRKSLTAHAISGRTVGLEWKNYFYPVSYTIQRKMESDTVFQDITSVDFPDNSFINSDLLPNTTYYYRIKVENSISDTIIVTTQSPVSPQAPESLVSLLTEKVILKIGWNDNSMNELGFIIERSDITSDNFIQIATVNPNVREFTNGSLTPNTSYYYRVKAFNEEGQSDFSNVLSIKTAQLQIPAAPSGLNANSVTKSSFVLNWKDNSNNEFGFQIYKLDESSGTFKLSQTAASNKVQLTIANLQPNTSHTYRVRAYNDDGVSGFTNELEVTTLTLQPPVEPIILVYDSLTPTSAYLRWTDRSDNENGFQIYRSLSETSGFQLLHTNSSNQNTYLNNNLDQGTTYFYKVRAYNDDGVSAYTNTLQIITPNPPQSPTNLILGNKSQSAISFGWTDNSDNETGFYLERSVNSSGQFVRTDTLEADTKEFTDQNLKSNTTYYYRLAAFNLEGSSAYSDTLKVSTSPLILPEPPSELKVVSIAPFSVAISWNDNSSNEIGFQIQRADQNDAFFNIAKENADITQYKDSVLDQNSIYHYRVRAYNNYGYSTFSDTLTIQTPENIIPPVPDSIITDLVRYNLVVLSWNVDMTHISGFEILRATDTSGYVFIARTGIVTTFSDVTVNEGIDYIYRVRSFNAYNYSPYSPAINVSVPFLVLPEPPELLSPANIESNAITIKWTDKSTDETGFIVKRALYPQTDFKELFTTRTNDTLFIDRTVTPNTTYYYIINAVNESGQSKNSNQLRVSSLSLAEAARCWEGLVAYYNFSLNSNNIVHDLSKYSNSVDLLVMDTLSVNWEKNSRIEIINSTMIRSQYPASKIVDACKKTNEITLECWIKPTLADYSSDATIISLSKNPENIGISLMQSDYCFSENKNYRYLLGLSTKSTEANGKPYLSTAENDIITLHHIAYTRNKQGEEILFLNGAMVANSIKPLGFGNWKNDYYLYLGNESTMEKPWFGMFYLVAIYDFALTTDQILQNYHAGPTDDITVQDNGYEIKLFPNPTTGRINFDIRPTESSDYGEKVIFQLVDLYGRVHLQEVINDSNQPYQKEFDLSHLHKGIYYFRLISPSGSTTQKISLF